MSQSFEVNHGFGYDLSFSLKRPAVISQPPQTFKDVNWTVNMDDPERQLSLAMIASLYSFALL